MAASLDLPIIHEIVEADLRSVFTREATVFTPWLARPENLDRLARVVGMRLEPVSTETSTGTFRVDLVARDVETDRLVLVENQFARSDHDHLGKALTYIAAMKADAVIWLAESFADEHRAVLQWLNDNSPEDIGFWAVVPKVLRVGDSPPGLRFEVIVRPNVAVKEARATEKRFAPHIVETRRRYWPLFTEALRADPDLSRVVTRHGGGSGFMHLFPDERFLTLEPSIHILAFLTLPNSGVRAANIWMRPNPEDAPQWADRIARLQSSMSDALNGQMTGEFETEEGLRKIAHTHVAAIKPRLALLAAEFELEASGVSAAGTDGAQH